MTKKRGDDGIDDSHIVEAQDLVQRGRLRNRIRDQTQYAHLLLETLASLEQRGATPARSKTIKTRYERVANAHAVDSRTTLKRIQNHLSELHKLDFLQRTNWNRGESGGRYDEYGLDPDPEIVLAIRDGIETRPLTRLREDRRNILSHFAGERVGIQGILPEWFPGQTK
ncbi:orc1/cdc6 family replication initiation protein [Halorubrum ezzemoulense]|uniref:orc1/cdc6 family replication initiation protein n=1 Tax=Halorubrum ezzemoulense TaxID=337243 RepID=UPI00232C0710|nr:orc1/cdc6 family replication initiation protein [Halorubrum ezzemoulense]MDB9249138.1 orc1/cdc6 family replication initiation protein [Halorubrum ezzemoulense]MDB9259707.1 orc1/cdc6 family replication initiation protein [Halorubrum ezzemoulense]MDB9263172.1 orc1/cdc6 family replication initiation protein [Halorubrum ezzemoulense]MDB9266398.1 orc1/cdc6 family replication initiation protein [Halorubrum ezzemoulense]MDB9270068.1 orc1/cdc6 family replication initiation protein [Halorubrum ezzem